MKHNRRQFLIKSSCALSMVALATQARHFGMMDALAQTVKDDQADFAPTDYRALVCVFLSGGNDGNNMVIPNHDSTTGGISNYAAYNAARGTQGLAIPQNQLLSVAVPRIGGLAYGLHPNFGDFTGQTPPGGNPNRGIHELFGMGKLAVVSNVGNLVYPTTKAQYQTNQVQKPYQLFSHTDQTAQQQSAQSALRSYLGWGGKIADLRNTDDNPGALIPMITSINGAQLFTNGTSTSPLSIASGGTPLSNVLVLNGYGTDAASTARRAALNGLRTVDLNQQVINAASHITDQAVQASQALSTFQEVTVAFPNTGLGNQLKQVARLIKKRTELNVKRQIFFVQIGSFDTHNGQVASPTQGQNGLLLQLSQALRAFYDELSVQGAQNSVTAFTLSDFGRTFVPAGTGAGIVGTDHAWGNHALVMGGSVVGGNFYGANTANGTPFPTLTPGGADDTDNGSGARGRWIPTTAVDQYAATLARWYGLEEAQMSAVFPNIGHFPTNNLEFMSS